MAAYEYQFVDSISATPVVRLDLRQPTWRVRVGTTFDPPELQRSAIRTLLRDGETYPAAAFGNRVINLVLQIGTASDDATAAALQALYRELDRPTNILRFRPSTSKPVHFRTFRSAPGAVEWVPHLKEVRVAIPAEPAAYGLRETQAVTIYNDPAAPSNGMFADLSILGDLATPLMITVPQVTLVGPDTMSVLSVRRRGNPAGVPLVLQAEAMTQGTGTTIQANDSDASGAGSNWSRTVFSGTGVADRLSISTWPTLDTPDVRGRYRVFARLKTPAASSTDVIYVRLKWGLNGSIVGGQEVQVGYQNGSVYTGWKMADLGLISFPAGADPGVAGLSGIPLPARGQAIVVEARRASGSANLDWDYLLFVPADDRLAVIRWNDIGVLSGRMVIDGTTETVYPTTSAGVVYGGGVPPATTGFVEASPGVTRLYWLRAVGPQQADAVSGATSLTVDYWPRYLHVRPVAS